MPKGSFQVFIWVSKNHEQENECVWRMHSDVLLQSSLKISKDSKWRRASLCFFNKPKTLDTTCLTFNNQHHALHTAVGIIYCQRPPPSLLSGLNGRKHPSGCSENWENCHRMFFLFCFVPPAVETQRCSVTNEVIQRKAENHLSGTRGYFIP